MEVQFTAIPGVGPEHSQLAHNISNGYVHVDAHAENVIMSHASAVKSMGNSSHVCMFTCLCMNQSNAQGDAGLHRVMQGSPG